MNLQCVEIWFFTDEGDQAYKDIIRNANENTLAQFTDIEEIDGGFIRLCFPRMHIDLYPMSLIGFCRMVLFEWTYMNKEETIFVYGFESGDFLVHFQDDVCSVVFLDLRDTSEWKDLSIAECHEHVAFLLDKTYWSSERPEIVVQMSRSRFLECVDAATKNFVEAAHKRRLEIKENSDNYIDESTRKLLADLEGLYSHYGLED